VKRLAKATIHSLRGLRYTIAHETAARQEATMLALAILLGFFVSPGPAWYVAMIGVLFILLAVELLNTAIEKLSDHVTPEHHVEIGIIKDAASAAVFCLLLVAGLVNKTTRPGRFVMSARASPHRAPAFRRHSA
jgi:diacylglycerol kinase (ATP)